jgi:hypothetical protein
VFSSVVSGGGAVAVEICLPAVNVGDNCAASADSATPPISEDDAAVRGLTDLLARAGVAPVSKRHDFASSLYFKLGVRDARALFNSLSANPPDFDVIKDIGMTLPQKRALEDYIQSMRSGEGSAGPGTGSQ